MQRRMFVLRLRERKKVYACFEKPMPLMCIFFISDESRVLYIGIYRHIEKRTTLNIQLNYQKLTAGALVLSTRCENLGFINASKNRINCHHITVYLHFFN